MRDKTVELLKIYEGFVDKPYYCPAGYLSVGYGHNLETGRKVVSLEGRDYADLPLTEGEATVILLDDIEEVSRDIQRRFSEFKGIPEDKQGVLIRMAFQMGVGGVMKFKMMLSALRSGDFKEAARQMLDSRWAKQTVVRAHDEAARMIA